MKSSWLLSCCSLIAVLLVTCITATPVHAQSDSLWDGLTEYGSATSESLQAAAPLDDIVYESDGFDMGGWLRPANWEGSFEVGINGSEGNSKNFNLRSGFDLSRKTDLAEVGIDLDYAKASTNGVESQNFARMDWDYNRNFKEGSPWSAFLKTSLLYDEFRPFDIRFNMNTGLGYKWIDTELTTFKTRAGFGTSKEFGSPQNEWVPEAVFGMDFRRQLTKRQKLNATVDYFPAFSDFQDYRLVSDLSWELLLDEANNMSLKLSILDTYDSTPNGALANDLNYGLLLLWKM